MINKGFNGYSEFLTAVLKNTGVSMCARSHFGSLGSAETTKNLRLAYSGIGMESIEEGLVKLKQYLEG